MNSVLISSNLLASLAAEGAGGEPGRGLGAIPHADDGPGSPLDSQAAADHGRFLAGDLFLCFSLLAPPNATPGLALTAAAISVAGAVFLIMELDQPLGGMIRISSAPMTQALQQLAK